MDNKGNEHCRLGSERVNVNFGVFKKINLSPGKVLKVCFQKNVQTL